MTTHDALLAATVLQRKAVVYVRQSDAAAGAIEPGEPAAPIRVGRCHAPARFTNGAIVGEHARCFGRGQAIYDPWHYVPMLARKPESGAPFKNRVSLSDR